MFDLRPDELVTGQAKVVRADFVAVANDATFTYRQKRLVTLSEMASMGVVLVSDWVMVASILS